MRDILQEGTEFLAVAAMTRYRLKSTGEQQIRKFPETDGLQALLASPNK
jgi:hypothetical protein